MSSDLNCSKNNCLFTQFNAKTHAKCELIYILMLMSLSSKIILKYLDNIHVLDIILIAVLINIIVSRGS